MERVDPETRSETFDGLKIALSEAQKHVRAHDTNTQIVGAGSVFAAIKALCILMLAALVTSGCARVERDIVGLGDASLTEGQKTAGTTRRVFLATTRQRSDDPAEFFGGDRSQVMQLGYMDVHIPASHRPGRIERPKGTKPDPDKHFILSEPTLFETDKAFQDEIDTELLEKVREERDVLVFVHGYNTNFSAAVLRVAQFVHDTNYTGVPVLFSWASRGKTFDYLYDLNSALQSRDELERLGVLLTGVQAKHFDVVAHSMGNLATLEAMRNLEKRRDLDSTGELRRVILASPDVDIDLFEAQLKDVRSIQDRITVLISNDDRALSLSRRLAGGVSRVGATDPKRIAALGLTVIDLTEIDDRTSSNHSKFASSPEIVKLIGRGIQSGNRLSAQTDPSAIRTVVGGIVRGVTIIPVSIVGGAQAVVVSVGN